MNFKNVQELALQQPPIMDSIMNHLYNSETKISMLNMLQVFNSNPISDVIHNYIDKQKRYKLNEIQKDLLFAKTMHELFNNIDDVNELNLSEEELNTEVTRCRLKFIKCALENKENILSFKHETFKYPCFWVLLDLVDSGVINESTKIEHMKELGLDKFEMYKL
tara:strand:- start:13960 stop:14451 length:492 start_codon:yes stop_codon:yes gene_type:complete